MQPIDTNPPPVGQDEQLLNIHPRICILHKWPHYDGYGIHLSRNKHSLGLHIDYIEPNSPAERGGLLREDIVLAVNSHSIVNEDFFVAISCIQYALEQDQIRFLVLDRHSAELAQRYQISINENNDNCIRIETSEVITSTMTQNLSHDEGDNTHKLSTNVDPNNHLKPELRMCSVILRSSIDPIGISLEPDTNFGHIISQVEPNSPADRAGIEKNDYIISVNHTSLIYVPFEDALYFLKTNRKETQLDFLLAKKSYLLQSLQNDSTSNRDDEVILSSNLVQRNKSFTLPATQTFEQSERNQQRATRIDEQHDRLSLQIYSDRYSAKHKNKHGKVLKGIGPARALRFSWNAKSEKTIDYGSIRSDLYGQRSGTKETKKRSSSMKVPRTLLQVGMTNPSPKQPARRIVARLPSVSFSDDGKRTAQSPLSIQRYRNSPKVLPSPSSAIRNKHVVNTPSPSLKHYHTIQNIRSATPITPSSPSCIVEQDNPHISKSNLYLGSLTASDDTGDDYSSTVSDESHKEEQFHPAVTNTSEKINNEFEDEESRFKSMKTSVSNVSTPENTSDDTESKSNPDIQRNENQYAISMSSDSDKETVVISTNLPTQNSEQSNVHAQAEDQSIAGTFYIPDESETEESKSNTLPRQEKKQIESSDNNQPVSTIPDQLSNKPTPALSPEMVLATTPISELSDHGYELLNIKLMQPTESIPLGFKLSKQTDSFQCVLSCIDKQSQADLVGLKVDDWLIKIEDNDIRLTDFSVISQNIYRTINTAGSINILIARKKSIKLPSGIDDQPTSPLPTNDKHKEANALLSVGLSNKIEDKNPNQSKEEEHVISPSNDIDKDKIRNIILQEALGLDFYSFVPDNNNQIQIHSITNVRPLSLLYRAGLRNGDRILSVNNIDVTNTTHKTVRHRLLKKSPVHLTVINDPKYLGLIENIKRKQNRITKSSASINYEPLGQQQPEPSNILSEDLVNVLFIDDKGPVYMKHCILKKEPTYKSMGFILRYINNFHTIGDVELDMPAYNSGLRDEDVVLCVNRQNVERMTHDDVKIMIRKLTLSNEVFHLILLNKNDMQRYKIYKEKGFIDWKNILSQINEGDTNQTQAQPQLSYVNNISNKPNEISTPSLLLGSRICILEPSATRSAGFSISGEDKSPFLISKIQKDSPADRAGLQLNDTLLSINGKSLIEVTYDETIQIIKEALQQKIVEIVVNQLPISKPQQRKGSNESLMSSGSDDSDNGDANNTANGTKDEEPCHRGASALHDYQRLRSKELSYTVRLCHLSATNPDGTPASTFGFDAVKESKYEYPMISRVESKLPGERSGLQERDLIIKVNGRKTKGADIEKVKRTIERAKHDGRLELLVIDEEVYRYGMRTNKKFKEPYIKVKHIFPRSRSSISFESLNSIAARASATSQDIINQLKNGPGFKVHRLSIPTGVILENEDDLSSSVFEETIDFDAPSSMDKKLSKEIQNQTSPDDSMVDSVLNTINNFFQNIGSEQSIQPVYDTPSDQTNNSKDRAPLTPTVHFERNLAEEKQHITRLYNTIRSNRSSGLYDYISDPRRCLLKIDRNKGLGFVLSATGDFDHTITAVQKNSIADAAGLHVDDEVVEINHVDVRNIKYDKVIQMLFSAMETHDTIEMCVINRHLNDFYQSKIDTNKFTTATGVLGEDLSYENSPINTLKQQTINTSYPNLHDQSKDLNNITIRNLSGSVPALSTGITASPKDLRPTKSILTSSKKDPVGKILNVSKKEAPIARLCRVRKFPSSPFYGFFLCGDPKRLGRVHISNISKNSSAAICGLRNGDRIIEVNGTNIQTLTYETILNKIKLHMERHDLELLVLDKKSLRWYRERKYPITSQTLPTIIHIEPILNNTDSGKQLSRTLDTQTKTSVFFDQQESTTSL